MWVLIPPPQLAELGAAVTTYAKTETETEPTPITPHERRQKNSSKHAHVYKTICLWQQQSKKWCTGRAHGYPIYKTARKGKCKHYKAAVSTETAASTGLERNKTIPENKKGITPPHTLCPLAFGQAYYRWVTMPIQHTALATGM